MPVTRRTVIKQFLYASAGIVLIPSCVQENKSKASVLLKNFSITGSEEAMLAELSETIIPKTATPGAKDISAHLFLLKMMDDCRSKEDQEKFLRGLKAFEQASKEKNGKSFTESNAEQRAALLKDLVAEKDKDNEAAEFFSTVKRYTVQAYTSSEYFLTRVQVYELVPGRYHGCVPVKAA